jgi:hypothetical protein
MHTIFIAHVVVFDLEPGYGVVERSFKVAEVVALSVTFTVFQIVMALFRETDFVASLISLPT